MSVFGKRFHPRRSSHAGKLHPAAIVGICLAAAVLLTVIVGNLLKLWVDDETYDRLTNGEKEETDSATVQKTNVRNINAYPFVFGGKIETVIAKPAVSVNLNTADGSMQYTSDVTAYLELTGNEKVLLHDSLSELSAFVSYIAGVFYPQAFLQETPDLRYAAALEESALLREFVRAGGSEVLLRGLPLDGDHIDAVCEYVTVVKAAVGNQPVGVAVPLSVVNAEGSWELLAALYEVCDFCALDLTAETVDNTDVDDLGISPSAEALLKNAGYYLSDGYGMRPLISSAQTALLSTFEAKMYPNYQVVD